MLCSKILASGRHCNNRIKSNGLCRVHDGSLTICAHKGCNSIMKKGSNVKFCRIHSPEFSSLDFCGFIRDNGSHCCNRVKKGDVYCYNHIGIDIKEEILDTKAEIVDEENVDIKEEISEPRVKCEYVTLKAKKKIKCELFALRGSPYCVGHQKIQDKIDTNEKEQLKPEELPEDNSEERNKYISAGEMISTCTTLFVKYSKTNEDISKMINDYRTLLRATVLNNAESFLGNWRSLKKFHNNNFPELEADEIWVSLINKMTELKNYYKLTKM